MKALTLHQPWASLIASGAKSIETRSWPPPPGLIGQRIAIHAGKRLAGLKSLGPKVVDEMTGLHGVNWRGGVPLGEIVATVRLDHAARVRREFKGYVEALVFRSLPGEDRLIQVPTGPFGDFAIGRWLWLLSDVQPCDPPVPAVGRRGIWEWESPDEYHGAGWLLRYMSCWGCCRTTYFFTPLEGPYGAPPLCGDCNQEAPEC